MPKRSEYGIDWYDWRGSYRVYRWGEVEEETVLDCVPDSAEWFELLGRIKSFNFRGKNGRFSVEKVIKKGRPYWYGWKHRRGVNKNVYLGRRLGLTIDRLELAAGVLEQKVNEALGEVH